MAWPKTQFKSISSLAFSLLYGPTLPVDAFDCDVGEDSVPWTARRSNQSILKEINPEYSLEGLMLKLKLQYFGNLT